MQQVVEEDDVRRGEDVEDDVGYVAGRRMCFGLQICRYHVPCICCGNKHLRGARKLATRDDYGIRDRNNAPVTVSCFTGYFCLQCVCLLSVPIKSSCRTQTTTTTVTILHLQRHVDRFKHSMTYLMAIVLDGSKTDQNNSAVKASGVTKLNLISWTLVTTDSRMGCFVNHLTN
uniref:DUF4371 domain-containing protein n=1 Tax=Caenorhabditis tropicalis TaxID=1561998 RepID=A0A1I7U0A0_9PELO